MSLATNLSNLSTRIATECKSIRILLNGNASDLSALTTTAKTNLVAAINELDAAIGGLSSGAGISDGTTGTSSTWSSTKITAAIAAAKSELVNGAGSALDTLNELSAALGNDPNFAATIAGLIAAKANASDVGSTTTDFVAVFETGLA